MTLPTLPDSKAEKDQSYKEDGHIRHWMYVHELKALLAQLQDTDWLTPNNVHNLLVEREIDPNTIAKGIVDFHFNRVEWFTTDTNPKDTQENT